MGTRKRLNLEKQNARRSGKLNKCPLLVRFSCFRKQKKGKKSRVRSSTFLGHLGDLLPYTEISDVFLAFYGF